MQGDECTQDNHETVELILHQAYCEHCNVLQCDWHILYLAASIQYDYMAIQAMFPISLNSIVVYSTETTHVCVSLNYLQLVCSL